MEREDGRYKIKYSADEYYIKGGRDQEALLFAKNYDWSLFGAGLGPIGGKAKEWKRVKGEYIHTSQLSPELLVTRWERLAMGGRRVVNNLKNMNIFTRIHSH